MQEAATVSPAKSWIDNHFDDEGNAPARDTKLLASSAGTEFVAGSVTADAPPNVTYSIGPWQELFRAPDYQRKASDGTIKKVARQSPVHPDSLRVGRSLDQGAKLNASYKVRLN